MCWEKTHNEVVLPADIGFSFESRSSAKQHCFCGFLVNYFLVASSMKAMTDSSTDAETWIYLDARFPKKSTLMQAKYHQRISSKATSMNSDLRMDTHALARHHKISLHNRVRIQTLPTALSGGYESHRTDVVSSEHLLPAKYDFRLSCWAVRVDFRSENQPQHNKLQVLATGSTN